MLICLMLLCFPPISASINLNLTPEILIVSACQCSLVPTHNDLLIVSGKLSKLTVLVLWSATTDINY